MLEGGGGVEKLFGQNPFEQHLSFHGSSLTECSEIDWDKVDRQFEEQGLPGQSYEEFLKTVPKLKAIDEQYEQDCDDYCDYYDDY